MFQRRHLFLIFLLFAGALALRFPRLETRPLHNDEAVNAIKVTELWEENRYRYDPDEYHGPTLHYATALVLSLSGAASAKDVQDKTLRYGTVIFGAGLILLLVLFRDGFSAPGLLWSGLFLAISPAMVFYSRYFIHEMLLVFFSALTIGAGWRYRQTRSPRWATAGGAGIGLMFATKETFVLSVGAMGIALIVTAWLARGQSGEGRMQVRDFVRATFSLVSWKHLALFLGAALLVWVIFFSSFFTHFRGLLDSVLTYFPWLKRAAGDSPHLHPWYFYFQRLGWFHPVKGPVWSEALILGLSAVGIIVSFRRNQTLIVRFIAIYSLVLAAIYSMISYKTPWCLLNFYFGFILLAGVGAAAAVEFSRKKSVQIILGLILLAGSAQLAEQSFRASYVYASDRRNPYVYAQTVPDLLNLVNRVEGIARTDPAGFETVVKVIAPESDYWPLPWYLRRFEHVGWYDKVPEDPFAPIVIVSADVDARLDEKSDRKWIMTGLTELRPTKFLELYVELDLWKKYVNALPPAPEGIEE